MTARFPPENVCRMTRKWAVRHFFVFNLIFPSFLRIISV